MNCKPAKITVLDLDLTGLKVGTGRCGSTVLSGITATLDGAAAGALNATFKLALPTDGSRQFFGMSKVVLKGGDRSSRSQIRRFAKPAGECPRDRWRPWRLPNYGGLRRRAGIPKQVR